MLSSTPPNRTGGNVYLLFVPLCAAVVVLLRRQRTYRLATELALRCAASANLRALNAEAALLLETSQKAASEDGPAAAI